MHALSVRCVMEPEHEVSGDGAPPVDVSEGVLPAVIRTRSDGSERFICYDDSEGAAADTAWLSVAADSTVSLLLWR